MVFYKTQRHECSPSQEIQADSLTHFCFSLIYALWRFWKYILKFFDNSFLQLESNAPLIEYKLDLVSHF